MGEKCRSQPSGPLWFRGGNSCLQHQCRPVQKLPSGVPPILHMEGSENRTWEVRGKWEMAWEERAA